MKLKKIIFYFVFLITSTAIAQEHIELPQTKPPKGNNARPEYLDKSHLTILGFTVGEQTMSDVMSKLGNPEIIDGKYYRSQTICYTSSHADDKTKLIFMKNPVADLLGFCLLSVEDDSSKSENCLPSDKVHKRIATQSGLHLGMTRKELVSTLGAPTDSSQNLLIYEYHIKEKMDEKTVKYYLKKSIPPPTLENLYWDVCSTLEAKFKNSRLGMLEVTKTITY